ncbi:MAG TPA: FAD-linked oxidase C-terminal domain-containing protein [Vicinamibacterales bacterium]
MPLQPEFLDTLRSIVGAGHVRTDDASREAYGADALKRGHPADAVVSPDGAEEIAAIMRLCGAHGVPLVPRGGGTGYTGGAVPMRGGLVLSLERMNRILEIDEENLVIVVEPNVITGTIQDAVEKVGLFYPPDPASLRTSVIGGNVAECAGGPRAFKYGTTKQYVLGLQAVLPNGDIVETGGKVVKNVVGYDLTHLLVGSEGTLAIITRIILRLVPKPPVQSTLRATFRTIEDAVRAVGNVIRNRVVPAAVELIDGDSLDAVAKHLGVRSLAPEGTGALLLLDVDGLAEAVNEEAARCERACRDAGATEILRARDQAERQEIWRVRRELSPALKVITPIKFNHDVVVPKGRIPQLFTLVDRLKKDYRLRIPCFGHAGDGNIHVNIMVTPGDEDEMRRAHEAERALFEGVVALEGSISGEHGIGFAKAQYLPLELDPQTIALMKRVKAAFDPDGLLNPGKIFPD